MPPAQLFKGLFRFKAGPGRIQVLAAWGWRVQVLADGFQLLPELASLLHQLLQMLLGPFSQVVGTSGLGFCYPFLPLLDLRSELEKLAPQLGGLIQLLLPEPLALLGMDLRKASSCCSSFCSSSSHQDQELTLRGAG